MTRAHTMVRLKCHARVRSVRLVRMFASHPERLIDLSSLTIQIPRDFRPTDLNLLSAKDKDASGGGLPMHQ